MFLLIYEILSCINVFFCFLLQGGFARVHELTDLTSNKTYAGKIIPKCRITKPHHKEKVSFPNYYS